MDAKKKNIKIVKSDTVAAAIKKGLVPYVDFVPLPKSKNKKITKKKINLREDRADTWQNLGNIAQMYYDKPSEAIDVLMKGSTLFKTRSLNTYVLCATIEKDLKNSKLNLNKLVEQNLEKYCGMIGQDYSKVAKYTQREIQKDKKKQQSGKIDRQIIINKIVEKHRRLVKNNTAKYKQWLNSNSHLIK